MAEPYRWVGLTGGIGSGKSSVARRLAELGAVVLDSDRIAREVVAAGRPGFDELVAAFGSSIVGADGEIDRGELGRRVFADQAARRQLEGIVHPRVRDELAARAAAVPPGKVVVNDVPLLIEAGLKDRYEAVIVVFASEELRVARLVAERGFTEADARSRIATQATDEQRHAAADFEILNEGTLQELHSQVDKIWEQLSRVS